MLKSYVTTNYCSCLKPKMNQGFNILEFRGRQAATYSSRLRFRNQDTHTNIQIYRKTGHAFNIDCMATYLQPFMSANTYIVQTNYLLCQNNPALS